MGKSLEIMQKLSVYGKILHQEIKYYILRSNGKLVQPAEVNQYTQVSQSELI